MADIKGKGNVLIVDDEETFRVATAALLAREGYHVVQAASGDVAAAILSDASSDESTDVVIADIRMPGNSGLELVQSIATGATTGGAPVPVILATGYPDVATAVQSIRLPVIAYLVKPFELPELLAAVERGVRFGRSRRGLDSVRSRLERWRDELAGLSVEGAPAADAASEMRGQMGSERTRQADPCGVDAYVALTTRHILESLMDLQHVARRDYSREYSQPAAGSDASPDLAKAVCHLLECPRLTLACNAINQTIATLERTKQSFKSRELADLRHHLESIRNALVP